MISSQHSVLAESRVAGVEPLRTEWTPRLADARLKLEDAVAARSPTRGRADDEAEDDAETDVPLPAAP